MTHFQLAASLTYQHFFSFYSNPSRTSTVCGHHSPDGTTSYVMYIQYIYWCLKLDTSSVMFLESLGRFRGLSTSYAPPPGDPSQGWSDPSLCPRWLASYHDSMAPPLLSHSHLEALSAALVVLRMALLFLSPSMPKLLKALAKERAANPLQPTSTGKHLALQPACWQSLTSPAYLESFLSKASSKQSSHGTVSSSSTACLVDSDTRTMSDRRVVTAIWLGNFSWCSRSTNNCQSLADVRMPAEVLLAGVGLSPALTKAMVFLELLCPCQSCADGFSNGLEDLVMPPPVPTISKCPCIATEDVFQGSSLGTQWACWCLCYAPCVQIWRAWKHVIHCLDEEFDAVRLGFPKLSPGHFPFNRILPSRPSSLLLHSHCLAGSHLLHCCSHLLLNKSSPFLPPGVHLGSWKGS